MNKKTITYTNRRVTVACDRNCNKAWGIVARPKIQLSDDDDDTVYLADGELGDAPADPGTSEGGWLKPGSPDYFPNKWCVRQCERCKIVDEGHEIVLDDWSLRQYNQPWKHPDVMQALA